MKQEMVKRESYLLEVNRKKKEERKILRRGVAIFSCSFSLIFFISWLFQLGFISAAVGFIFLFFLTCGVGELCIRSKKIDQLAKKIAHVKKIQKLPVVKLLKK